MEHHDQASQYNEIDEPVVRKQYAENIENEFDFRKTCFIFEIFLIERGKLLFDLLCTESQRYAWRSKQMELYWSTSLEWFHTFQFPLEANKDHIWPESIIFKGQSISYCKLDWTYSATFFDICYHYQHTDIFLPDHSPESKKKSLLRIDFHLIVVESSNQKSLIVFGIGPWVAM